MGLRDFVETMGSEKAGTPIEDIAYLARSDHRVPTLAAVAVRPRSRSELVELTGVSSSTIRRTLREYEDRKWVRRVDYQYEATALGASVATAMVDLIERLETQHQLRDVWGWLPGEESGFTLDMCADATVSVASSDDPYQPVNRFLSLLEDAEYTRLVGFDVAMLEPCQDELCANVVGGMETEIITPPRVAEYIRSHCPDPFSESLQSGNLTMHLHDDLPQFAVCVLDERVAVCGYDADSVTVRVLVDTESPQARDWAESVYRRYLNETPTIPLERMQGASEGAG